MNWEKIRRQLRREAREYLADLRQFGEALRYMEGWLTLGLLLAVAVMMVAWFITGLGFDRLNSLLGSFSVWRPRVCRPLTDFNAMVLILDSLIMVLLSIISIGEMMRLLDRKRWGGAPNYKAVAIPAFFMLIASIAGIIYMRIIC